LCDLKFDLLVAALLLKFVFVVTREIKLNLSMLKSYLEVLWISVWSSVMPLRYFSMWKDICFIWCI